MPWWMPGVEIMIGCLLLVFLLWAYLDTWR